MKVKVSNRRIRVEETWNNVLIPADLKVVDLMKAYKVIGNVSGIFEISDLPSNMWTTDTRTAMELGWRHGTELKLEIL